MRISPTLAAVPLLLLLLTWLLLQGMNTDADLFDRTLAALDDFSKAEAALRGDVLSARAGLLHNYDPLVGEVNELNDALARLQDVQASHPRTVTPIRELAAAVARQEGLTEEFKSDNALLQNSLAYFGLFDMQLGASDLNGPIFPVISPSFAGCAGQAGYNNGVPRLGIPPLRQTDGPAGVRLGHEETALPAPVGLTATFDRHAAHEYGLVIGREGRATNQDVLYAPMINQVTVPTGGRNFETLGEDPFLMGEIVAHIG